jgi:hypothetical protein
LVFGGQVTDRVLWLWEFLGAQTHAARIERNARDRPLGGYVVAHRRTVVMSVFLSGEHDRGFVAQPAWLLQPP